MLVDGSHCLQIKLMTFKDRRVKFMTELLNGIKACMLGSVQSTVQHDQYS